MTADAPAGQANGGQMSVDLEGRVAVVTGVSRRAGIGFALARDLLAANARVLVHSWTPHDDGQPWGADPAGIEGVVAALGGPGPRLDHIAADFADAGAPAAGAPGQKRRRARTGRWSDMTCCSTSAAATSTPGLTRMWSVWLCGRPAG